MRDREKAVGQRQELVGVFNGYTIDNKALTLRIKSLFFKYKDIELICPPRKTTREFLDTLEKGDELTFEAQVASYERYSPQFALLALARIYEPSKRIECQLPKSNALELPRQIWQSAELAGLYKCSLLVNGFIGGFLPLSERVPVGIARFGFFESGGRLPDPLMSLPALDFRDLRVHPKSR